MSALVQNALATRHRNPRVRAAEVRMLAELNEENFKAFCSVRQNWQDTDPAYQAVAELYRSRSWGPGDHVRFARIFNALEREFP